jgi:lipopolysaccharide assembly outer membrane protein LptD (OstA)
VISVGEKEEGVLKGNSRVTFGNASLAAHRIRIDFDASEIHAYRSDSSTTDGIPTFTRESETFSGDQFSYNLETDRGRITGARSSIEEGFIRAAAVKTRSDSTVFVYKGVYSTCECIEDPSYSLRATRMKIVDKKWVYTGPIRLYIFNIATPLWLPFGFLPAQEGRRSGPVPPVYGEDDLGFYLRDFGWYFALNDYMDLQLQAGIWTRGSWQSAARFRYNRRYGYSGGLNLAFARLRNGERGDPDFRVNQTSSIRWNHSQTLNPYASFDASVDLTTSGYLQAISEAYDDRVRQTVGSTVSHRKRWSGTGRSITTKLSQQQQLATGSANVTLPSVSFSQSSRKPFERKSRAPGQKEQWFEKITYSYNGVLTNSYAFDPLSDEVLLANGDSSATDITWYDALFSQDKYVRATGDRERFAFKTSHSIPVNASFTLNRIPLLGAVQLNLSPSFRYTEDWLLQTERRSVDSTNKVIVERVPGFFALRQFNTGASANTTIYGLFPFRAGPYRGIRHTLRPTVGFTYQPDFYASKYGYARTYADTSGAQKTYAIASGVRRGEQQSLRFAIANTFETKKIASDSTRGQTRTVKLFSLDAQTSYNLAADSLKLSDVSVSGRTKLFGQVDINSTATLSPYRLDDNGVVFNEYVFDAKRFRFARLTQIRTSARTSIRSKNRGTARPLENPRGANPTIGSGVDPLTGLRDVNYRGTDAVYTDFAIPWSLTLDFTYSLSKRTVQSVRSAIVNASVDFNLTPNWKIAARTGYDFEKRDVVTTNLSVYRDFECWQLSLNWIPFGTYQSWGFDLHVKSGHLRDFLRIRQPRSDVGDRFSRL